VCRWTFDDGATAEGERVDHVFAAPDLRRVTLAITREGKPIVSLTREVRVAPLWARRDQWRQDTWTRQRGVLAARDFAQGPLSDLEHVFQLVHRIDDGALLARTGKAFLVRHAECTDSHAQVFYDLGFFFQRPKVRRYDEAVVAFRRAIAFAEDDPELLNRSRMHLAGLLIHCLERVQDGETELGRIDVTALTDGDKRLKKIYDADALLASGNITLARRLYRSVGTVGDPADVEYAVTRRARLELVKRYVNNGEYDAAQYQLRGVEWETPIERINTETGHIMVKIHIGREEWPPAHSRCRMLLLVADGDAHRPEILYTFVQICRAMGREAEAGKAIEMLLEEHPYSEAAARAKEE